MRGRHSLALTLVVLAAAVAVSGCAEPAAPAIDLGHVHGLAFHGGRLYVATHHGLAAGTPEGADGNWSWAYVGSDRHDYMGFTADAHGVFYASGHPDDPHAYGATMLGLRRSTDLGETWEERSLQGQADFHALAAMDASGRLAAFWRGTLMESGDGGATWAEAAAPPGGDVLALAASDGALWAGTRDGLHLRLRTDDWAKVTGLSGTVASLAVSPDGRSLLATQFTADGGVGWRSLDGGQTWTRLEGHRAFEAVQAPVLFAFDRADAAHAFASDASARIAETRDGGATWTGIRG